MGGRIELERTEPRLGLTRPEDLPERRETIERVEAEWPNRPPMNFWERLRAAWHIVTKPDPTIEEYGMEKQVQKHDWVSTIIGTLSGLALVIAEQEALPMQWRTYIMAGALVALGFVSNSWGRLIAHLPILAKQVIVDVTGSRKVEEEEDDDENLLDEFNVSGFPKGK